MKRVMSTKRTLIKVQNVCETEMFASTSRLAEGSKFAPGGARARAPLYPANRGGCSAET